MSVTNEVTRRSPPPQFTQPPSAQFARAKRAVDHAVRHDAHQAPHGTRPPSNLARFEKVPLKNDGGTGTKTGYYDQRSQTVWIHQTDGKSKSSWTGPMRHTPEGLVDVELGARAKRDLVRAIDDETKAGRPPKAGESPSALKFVDVSLETTQNGALLVAHTSRPDLDPTPQLRRMLDERGFTDVMIVTRGPKRPSSWLDQK